jgi:uncharacterized protein (DUF169 family)
MTDLRATAELLKKRGKVRGNPVGISLFRDAVPEGYEPIGAETPCAIVHLAMDEGRRVYFDAGHHDCLVGMHHAGIIPGKREIVSGEYLSKTSSFFTYEGAARLKSGSPVLPTGMVTAIGAAPLDQVPEGVPVDWIIVVANPHHANFIATCRTAVEGVPAYCSCGNSLCAEIFAMPWHLRNMIMTFGDQGGRMHNKMKQDQVFVVIPIEFAGMLPVTLENVRVDVKASRRMTKPEHSPFWSAKGPPPEAPEQGASADTGSPEELKFTMSWTGEARMLLGKVPEGIREMVVENAEDFARDKGYAEVSRKSMDEQMAQMGTSIDEMLDSM